MARAAIFSILLICALLACVRPISAQGWYQEFTPTRTFYISPSGSTSPTGSETDPYSLSQVIAQGFAQPGDLYYALPGTYNAGANAYFTVRSRGNDTHPIVLRALQGAKLTSALLLYSSYTWIWGWEITGLPSIQHCGVEVWQPNAFEISYDPVTDSYPDYSLAINVYNRFINNWIHDNRAPGCTGCTGICVYFYDRSIVYGNVVHGHGDMLTSGSAKGQNIYVNNDQAHMGTKYIVGNIFGKTHEPTSYNFDAWSDKLDGGTDERSVSGLYIYRNIFYMGKWVVGTDFKAPRNNVIMGNYYARQRVWMGNWPNQFQMTDNYLAYAWLHFQQYQGANDPYSSPSATVFANNTLLKACNGYLPADTESSGIPTCDQRMIWFKTLTYTNSGGACCTGGTPPINPSDAFNDNVYSDDFSAYFWGGGVGAEWTRATFAQWRNRSQEAGNGFDSTSSTVPVPTEAKWFMIRNDYESNRAHLAVYNWANASSVTVDISGFAEDAATICIYRYTDLITPLSCTSNTSPTLGGFTDVFDAFVLITNNSLPQPTTLTAAVSAVTASTASTTSTAAAAAAAGVGGAGSTGRPRSSSSDHISISGGAIAGIVIAVLVVIALIAVVVAYLVIRRKRSGSSSSSAAYE